MPFFLAQFPASPDIAAVVLFWVFATVTGVSAIGLAASRNIVHMAVWLLFTLIGVAALYFLLAAEFLAAVQLVVYVGGTLILIVFGVMLTSKSPFSRFQPSGRQVAVAIVLGVVLLSALGLALLGTTFPAHALDPGAYPVATLGQAFLGDFLIPFELASVLLLVVMIGAAYLAKARRHKPSDPVR
jgi:NADH-quinone oxidoreductase subunit J